MNKSQTTIVKPLEGSVSPGHIHMLAITMGTKDRALSLWSLNPGEDHKEIP